MNKKKKDECQEQYVEVICKNTQIRKFYPIGVSLEEIIKDQNISLKDPVIAAKVNNRLKELSYKIFNPKTIEFIDISDPSAYRMYLRASIFATYKAVKNLYPQATLNVEHSLPNGIYCEIPFLGKPINQEVIDKISTEIEKIIQEDLPFTRIKMPTQEAIEIYEKEGLSEKKMLFEGRKEFYTTVYFLDGTPNYFYGYLVPSTSHLKKIKLSAYHDGIIIHWISKEDEKNKYTSRSSKPSKLYSIIQEHKDWLHILGVPYVGDLNLKIKKKQSSQLIKISEALHEKKIASIADKINQRKDCKIALISGPSSSGKTTFCKRLTVQLQVLGRKTLELSLDDYFLNRTETPRKENGDYDFESINAIDISFFNKQLQQLLNGEEIDSPTFNFYTGEKEFLGKKLKLEPSSILIIEGIHGLNPLLTQTIEEKQKFKIFTSALTHISIDKQNPIKSTDNRLIRRIIRDYQYRGYSAQETLKQWINVRAGEETSIFPFQENADVMFNTALLFELSVLRKIAEPLLREVPEISDEYMEASRLLKFLSYFHEMDDYEIPPTSIIREFIGGGSFIY